MAGRKRQTTDEEILRAIALSPHPVVVASELGDSLDMTRQGIHSRLESLEKEGKVESAMKAASRVWSITDAGRQSLSSAS